MKNKATNKVTGGLNGQTFDESINVDEMREKIRKRICGRARCPRCGNHEAMLITRGIIKCKNCGVVEPDGTVVEPIIMETSLK